MNLQQGQNLWHMVFTIGMTQKHGGWGLDSNL